MLKLYKELIYTIDVQIVFYLKDAERDRLIDELVFLLRKVYGNDVALKQMSFQVPHVVQLVQLLLSFTPKESFDEFVKQL